MGGHHSAQALHFRVHHRVSTLGMILDDAGCPRVGVVTWGLVANGGRKVSTLPCCRGLRADVGLAFVPSPSSSSRSFLFLSSPSRLSLFLWFLPTLRSSSSSWFSSSLRLSSWFSSPLRSSLLWPPLSSSSWLPSSLFLSPLLSLSPL